MADISKCPGVHCPLKDSCYRYTAEPNQYRQAYSSFMGALNEAKTECQYFMEIIKKGLKIK